MAKRTRRLRKKGGGLLDYLPLPSCLGRCKRGTVRALNNASKQLIGQPAIYLGEREERLGQREADKRQADAELAKEKQIAKAADEAREAVAQAKAAKAKREKEEKEEADARAALAKAEEDAAAEQQRQELEARRAREAEEAAKAVEIRKLEQIIKTAARKETEARQAENESKAKLAGISDPYELAQRKELTRKYHDAAMAAKGDKKRAEGALEALKRGGRRSTRRRKRSRRRR